MAMSAGYVMIDSRDIAAVLGTVAHVAKRGEAVPMLLAIAFEYSLLMADMTEAERDELRMLTLREAQAQARHFMDVAHKKRL